MADLDSVAGDQFYKCANKPFANIKGLENHMCSLWEKTDENKGSFDVTGYKIWHDVPKPQALCHNCYDAKIKNIPPKLNRIAMHEKYLTEYFTDEIIIDDTRKINFNTLYKDYVLWFHNKEIKDIKHLSKLTFQNLLKYEFRGDGKIVYGCEINYRFDDYAKEMIVFTNNPIDTCSNIVLGMSFDNWFKKNHKRQYFDTKSNRDEIKWMIIKLVNELMWFAAKKSLYLKHQTNTLFGIKIKDADVAT